MSQHDLNISSTDANTGLTMRAAINSALQALGSMQSSTSAPATTYPCMLWYDTASSSIKQRDAGDSTWIPLKQVLDITMPVRDTARNLIMANHPTSAAHMMVFSADEIIVQNSDGVGHRLTAISATVNIETTGKNGRGNIASEVADTWYHAWVIAKGASSTAYAGLISTAYQSTSVTLPSSFTMMGYIGPIRNSSASNFLAFRQVGKTVAMGALNSIVNGQSTLSTGVSLSAFVPPNVCRVGGYCEPHSTAAVALMYLQHSTLVGTGFIAIGGQAGASAAGGFDMRYPYSMQLTTDSVAYSVSDATAYAIMGISEFDIK